VIVLTSLSQKNAEQLARDGAAGFFEKAELSAGHSSLLAAMEKILRK
jgi:hypothetical protein